MLDNIVLFSDLGTKLVNTEHVLWSRLFTLDVVKSELALAVSILSPNSGVLNLCRAMILVKET